jgi:OOP family OmpA-OmpF porin
MKKTTLALCLTAATVFSTSAIAHPECLKKEFWDNTPDNCVEHTHEETLVGAEEKHIVYFAFDKSDVGDIQDITNYIDSLKQLDSITLVGHADRLGSDDYNDALSKRRVDAVEQRLIDSGVDASKISTDYKGERIPAESCDTESGSELIECLFANRRVEIEIVGEKVLEQEAAN